MGTPYLGEIRVVSFNFPPKTWAFCNGQILPIAQNQALFSLLGTTYGGNGATTFALPDLRGRAAMHLSGSHPQGETAGQASHTLTIAEMPAHNHFISGHSGLATSGATVTVAQGNTLAQAYAVQQGGATTPVARFGTGPADGTLAPGAIGAIGGSQPHENMQPYLALHYCIALQGIFPSRN